MNSPKIILIVLVSLIYASLQQACSSNTDCTAGSCYSVSTTIGSASGDVCTYSSDGNNDPTTMPYQECLTSSQETAASGTDYCTVIAVSTTSCQDDTDCSSGNCCISQTCPDDSGSYDTNFFCAPPADQDTSTAASNGCVYGSCVSDNYVPYNFPCSSTTDCFETYRFEDYCCADLDCSGTDSGTFCVPSTTAGLDQQNQFGGTDAGCTAQCLNPTDAICTAVPYDQSSGTQSECAVYDNSENGSSYCCAVAGEKDGFYATGVQGVCMNTSELEEPVENENGTYTTCSALSLFSPMVLLIALNLI